MTSRPDFAHCHDSETVIIAARFGFTHLRLCPAPSTASQSGVSCISYSPTAKHPLRAFVISIDCGRSRHPLRIITSIVHVASSIRPRLSTVLLPYSKAFVSLEGLAVLSHQFQPCTQHNSILRCLHLSLAQSHPRLSCSTKTHRTLCLRNLLLHCSKSTTSSTSFFLHQ